MSSRNARYTKTHKAPVVVDYDSLVETGNGIFIRVREFDEETCGVEYKRYVPQLVGDEVQFIIWYHREINKDRWRDHGHFPQPN